jgi:hypothetical protein
LDALLGRLQTGEPEPGERKTRDKKRARTKR